MALAVADPALRRELEEQQAVKAVTDGWMRRLDADLQADRDRSSPVRRGERGLGVVLVVLGLCVLWGWGWVQVLLDASAPAPVRGGLGLLSAGVLLLLIHVVRTRFFSGDKDPYDEVIR